MVTFAATASMPRRPYATTTAAAAAAPSKPAAAAATAASAGGMRPEEYVLPRLGPRRWALVVAVGVAGAVALSMALERYIEEATRRTPRPPRLVSSAASK